MEQTIGKYKILREIGKGGMGVVYKAMDPDTQRIVAVKVLPSIMVDRAAVERFNREATAMSKLNHPNIVRVNDFGAVGGQHYMAMEYIDGKSLKAMIKHKGQFSVKETLLIIAKVTDALSYAHKEGMIHRDIKSANIMIDNNGLVKVMDFGLVQIPGATRVTSDGAAVGTAEYMSPEQINGADVDSRTDIYSVGVTMYEMLSGKPPFQAESVQAVLVKQRDQRAPLISSIRKDVPKEVENIVTKAMAKEVSLRYQKADDLLADILKITGRNILEKKGVNYEKIKSKGNKKGKKSFVKKFIGLTVFLTIAGGIYWFWINNPEFKLDIEKNLNKIGISENLQRKIKLSINFLDSKVRKKEATPDMLVQETEKILEALEKADSLRAKALDYELKGDYVNAIKAWKDSLKYDSNSQGALTAKEHIKGLSKDQ